MDLKTGIRTDAPSTAQRITSLDGLRGLAAVVVVMHHLALTSTPLANAVGDPTSAAAPWVQVLAFTPVHLLWEGSEAVVLFFVLSGLVLTLPWLTPGRTGWVRYYAARLPRLYLPVWAALAVSVLIVAAVYPTVPGANWWLNQHIGVDPSRALRDALLVTGTSDINSPIWSLQWEVIFSLLLPLYVLTAKALRPGIPSALAAVALVAMIVTGKLTDILALQYLPVFGFGALLATNADLIAAFVHRAMRPQTWVVVGVVVAVLINGEWLGHGLHLGAGVGLAAKGGAIVGCCGLLVMALHSPRLRQFLGSTIMRWLGTRSFSLYLTHEPIVVGAAFLVGSVSTGLTALAALPFVLGIGEAFFRLVERPSHRLARATARFIARSSESSINATSDHVVDSLPKLTQ